MKKSILLGTIVIFTTLLSGCGSSDVEEAEETVNDLLEDYIADEETTDDNVTNDDEVIVEEESNSATLTADEIHEMLRYELVGEIYTTDESEDGKLNILVDYDSTASFEDMQSYMQNLLEDYDNFGKGGYGMFMNMAAENDDFEFGVAIMDYSDIDPTGTVKSHISYQIEAK